MDFHRHLVRIPALAAGMLALAVSAVAGTAVGDWGHFLGNKAKVVFNNPDGRAWSIGLHVMQWPLTNWNKAVLPVSIVDPGGKNVAGGDVALIDGVCAIAVPAGARGAYHVQADGLVWLSSSLDQSVLWTGDPAGRNVFRDRQAPVFQAVVPRRWWFWVPADVTRFSCKAQRSSEHMSQREDWGIFIISPRGQRIRALWGQPPHTAPADYTQDMVAEVEVEPGSGGRFWSLEMRFGDSHNYSKPNICLDGVPPYLARSPEEWFDPATGRSPPVKVYDEDPFIQSARIDPAMRQRWPNLQHFSPCPSLGDPDGIEVLWDARFALWNPDGRELQFRIGTYLPRQIGKDPAMAQVRVTGARGPTILDKLFPLLHIHEAGGQPTDSLATGKGVAWGEVKNGERWLAFTYPATPLVLVGKDMADGWHQFRFTAGTARNWYFFVPRGCAEFAVRASAQDQEDVMHFEVNAPDRTLALFYANAGSAIIGVPPGLDGKIWHLRPDIGSATRMPTSGGPECRYQEMRLTVDMKGVPGYLAPTWEQWFDPTLPVPSVSRALP